MQVAHGPTVMAGDPAVAGLLCFSLHRGGSRGTSWRQTHGGAGQRRRNTCPLSFHRSPTPRPLRAARGASFMTSCSRGHSNHGLCFIWDRALTLSLGVERLPPPASRVSVPPPRIHAPPQPSSRPRASPCNPFQTSGWRGLAVRSALSLLCLVLHGPLLCPDAAML